MFLDNRLYIVGGLSSLNNMALSTTECYNLLVDRWEHPTIPLPHALLASHGVAIDWYSLELYTIIIYVHTHYID